MAASLRPWRARPNGPATTPSSSSPPRLKNKAGTHHAVMSRLPPMPPATLASRLKFCCAASSSPAALAEASAFMRSILAATAVCSCPAWAATKAAAIEAVSILYTRNLILVTCTRPRLDRDRQAGDCVDPGAVGHGEDVVLG